MIPVVAVHGGAGSRRGWRNYDRVRKELEAALDEGVRALRTGSAVDAVEAAIRYMEDSGVFNAGVGSVLDLKGGLSMDAGIMDGRSLRAGAVAAVEYPKNPVVLARKVMERTGHVILAGKGADELAERLSLPRHPGPSERAIKRWKELLEKVREGGNTYYALRYKEAKELGLLDTVGAVAVDADGGTAAAVSTGGVIMKFPGRVGDSPIPGAGFYADRWGAAAATGYGEVIIMSMACLRAVERLASGSLPSEAAWLTVSSITALFGSGNVGIIVADRHGRVAAARNTEVMSWGYLRPGYRPSIYI